MNTDTDPRSRVLHTDDQLRDMIELLLQKANQRQLWMLFIDPRGCLGEPIMPMAGYPEDPLATVRVEDLGEVAESHVLMHRIGAILEMTGNAAVVLAWERPGTSEVREVERAWVRAMAEQAADLGVPLRAQFLLHGDGVRQIHPDDYL